MTDKVQTWTERLMKAAFYFGILFTCIAPVVIGVFYEDKSTSWVAALCGAFITFIARFDELSELTLGPVKAKMKARIEEANAAIESLQAIATPMAEVLLSELGSGHFIAGMSLQAKYQLSRKVVASLNDIGVTREAIKNAEANWVTTVSFEYVNKIKKEISELGNTKKEEEKKTYNEAIKAIDRMYNPARWAAQTPSEIRTVLDLYKVSGSSIDEWLEDYEHYRVANVIRNEPKLFN